MPVPASAPRKLPWLLVVLSLCVMGLSLLLMGAPGAAYAGPLQQGNVASFTPYPTDLAGGFITLIETVQSDVGVSMVMEIGPNGNPIILYSVEGNNAVLVTCADPQCMARSTRQLPINYVSDMVLQFMPSQGGVVPVILYRQAPARDRLRLVRCTDIICTSLTQIIDIPVAPGFVDLVSSPLARTTEVPWLAYFQPGGTANSQLLLTACEDIYCSTTTVDYFPGTLGTSVTLGLADGAIPVMVYNTVSGLAFARCESATSCLSPTINQLVSYGAIGDVQGNRVAMAFNPQGNPVILYELRDLSQLLVAVCGDPFCTTVERRLIEDPPAGGFYGSGKAITFGNNGDMYLAYDRLENQIFDNGYNTYFYLFLRRCSTQRCDVRNLVRLDEAYPYMGRLTVWGERVYILYQDHVAGSNPANFTINLYMGEPPPVADPTAGPSPTVTASRTPNSYDLTTTINPTYFTPSITRTATPTGSIFPTQTATATGSATITATPNATIPPSATFTPSSPPNAAPQRNRFTTYPFTLTWMGTAGQNLYELQIALDASFQQVVYMNNTVLGRSAEVYLSNGFYYWRVRAVLDNGQFSPWSGVDTFAVMVPTATP